MKYLENLMIYFGNLSAFYIFSVAISVAVVLLTIYLGIVTRLTNASHEHADRKSFQQSQNHSSKGDGSGDSDSENENLRIESLRQLKSAKLKSLERQLTDEQRQAEKEMEKAQLSAIFELLKQQSERFDLGGNLNEDDLKEQLTLYR